MFELPTLNAQEQEVRNSIEGISATLDQIDAITAGLGYVWRSVDPFNTSF